jgi:hypothetical protein
MYCTLRPYHSQTCFHLALALCAFIRRVQPARRCPACAEQTVLIFLKVKVTSAPTAYLAQDANRAQGSSSTGTAWGVASAHEGSAVLNLKLSKPARLVRLHSSEQKASRAVRDRARRTQTARRARPPPAQTSCW